MIRIRESLRGQAGRRRGTAAGVLVALSMLGAPVALAAQETIQTQVQGVITVPRGSSAVITRPDSLRIVDIANPDVADYRLQPPNQLIVWGKTVGTTSLVLWGASSIPRIFTIEVTADVESLRRQLADLFPDTEFRVNSTGQTVILSGEVRDPAVRRKALELANTLEVPIVDNISAPAPEQILLHVEFAEVSRSVMKELGADMVHVLNPETLDQAFDKEDTHDITTVSSGLVTLLVEGAGSRLDAMIKLLKNSGEFKSLSEPNLVTIEGQEATFLAGGEFPFPSIQGGQSNAVTITWKEYGVRLNFTPTITNVGNVRLAVEPEVSSLDFANGLTFGGFQIPSVLSRRVTTDVELASGQTLAIGGLLDNSMLKDVDKIPVLGDIPILGYLFKSESVRQNRTELLVLVTPYILDPDQLPAPALPTGTPEGWDWDGHIGDWIRNRADTTAISAGGGELLR